MTPAQCAHRDRLFALMRRYCQLGHLIDPNFDRDDIVALAETKIIVAEMREVQGEIDALLGRKAH
jgi:hypothetical protein